jgi:hypothetical protein
MDLIAIRALGGQCATDKQSTQYLKTGQPSANGVRMANTIATATAFTQQFPEWALAWALKLATRDDPSRFWAHAVYRPLGGEAIERPLAQLLADGAAPQLKYERALTKNEAAHFGVEEEVYGKTFWSLRPDFLVESEGALLIFEAKGGQIRAEATWRNPKELVYHRFLQACTTPKTRGLFYVVPRASADDCAKCLRDEFPLDASITMGVLTWEQLLPLIYDSLIETALDQVIKELKGLEQLREWRRGKSQ